ncbi:hypothetical protein EKL97_04045 [Flavobacterium sp. LS1P28]|uniref:hypothetical protein n=1 Tax=Flavobacterium sp. LS1P28 TaxID=2497752 RepID=UPI000F824DA7|nr:hypothetical protein [Flavobacterium sp. LS1P28]RTY83461.1 hypothetical protein EKL97_04045 [Flavobacterium sp. LS1P28]
MKKIAFTICAKNYIGLALALEKSIKEHNNDVDFLIFVADEFSDEEKINDLPDNIIIAKDTISISQEQWNQMSFKYDLTEFCTSIKPSCFKYVFEKFNPYACIYFDPDILVFNSLDTIFNKLQQHSIIVTPHITTIEDLYTGKLNERNLLYSGMFNLGFLALKRDEYAKKMLDWWEIRLEDRCFQNMMENYFTDQKWMDFLPSFFPNQLVISHDLGLNVAPWNFYEREIIDIDNSYFVKNRIKKEVDTLYPLTFVHFSGYNYNALINGEIVQGNIKNFEDHVDLKKIFDRYANFIKQSDFSRYVQLSYTYNYFSNQVSISSVYRKLFRRLHEDKKINSNPFDASNSFYLSLKQAKLINERMLKTDKVSIATAENVEQKTLMINKLLKILFKCVGANRFFMLMRLMRLYSKIENHVYLIDKSYLKNFKIRN